MAKKRLKEVSQTEAKRMIEVVHEMVENLPRLVADADLTSAVQRLYLLEIENATLTAERDNLSRRVTFLEEAIALWKK